MFKEAKPFFLSLEEAKITTRAAAPFVIFWDSNSLFEDLKDIFSDNSIMNIGENWFNILFGADISVSIFIGPYTDVTHDFICTDKFFKGLQFLKELSNPKGSRIRGVKDLRHRLQAEGLPQTSLHLTP